MTEASYEGTIDWDRYWTDAEDPHTDEANGGGELLLGPLQQFIDARGVPDSHADVGCGGGEVVFTVADRHSETTVVGYDAAESVVEANRHRAGEGNRPTVRFEQAQLPDFDPDRQFDLVTALFTLCYVPDVEAAVEALYDAVAPGGDLVITYHNRHARRLFEVFAEDPHEHLPPDSAWDPDTFAERFELVIEGESLLSYDRIHEAVGTWPQSVWSVVEADRYGAWKQNPFVYVPKPD